MAVKKIDNRFRTLGKYTDAEMRRDLKELVDKLNEQLAEAQTQISDLKARIDTAGIP